MRNGPRSCTDGRAHGVQARHRGPLGPGAVTGQAGGPGRPRLRHGGLRRDAPFHFSDESVPVVGVVVQAPAYIEGVLTTLAEVDGHDATERIASMVSRSRYRAGLAMVLIDGTAVGGFNVIDVDALHEKVERPVVTVTRRKPDLAAIETALRRRFDDWEDRLRIMRRHRVEAVRVRQGTLWVSYVGTDRTAVQEALRLATVRGVLPEPLRIAHLIAAGIMRGESRGRA